MMTPDHLAFGDLVHRRDGDRAAGEAGPEDPVHVERLPGAVRPFAHQRHHEEREADDGEAAADHREILVVSGQALLDQPVADRHQIGGHYLVPPAGAAGSGEAACSERT